MKRAHTYMAITGERDSKGRAPFTLYWLDVGGVFRPEPSKVDGEPVGYRRSQCFRAVPENYIRNGAVLVDSEDAARALAWAS